MEFAGEEVHRIGSIELPLTAWSIPKQSMIMVKFRFIDSPGAYNAIVGRTVLNQLRAVTSTPHQKMKFSTENCVGEVRGDQWTARQCYNVTLKDTAEKASPETGSGTGR